MRLIIAAMLCATAFAANAQMYRWTDANGKVHYTSTPPPTGSRDVKKQDVKEPAPAEAAVAGQPFALQQAVKSYPVTLYTTPGCEACDEARKLLNGRGIPFSEVSVTEEAQIEQLKKVVGSGSVPAMVVGKTVQKGYEEGMYTRALDAAGYPRAGILPPRSQTEPGPGQPAPVKLDPVAPAAPAGRYSTDNIRDPFKR